MLPAHAADPEVQFGVGDSSCMHHGYLRYCSCIIQRLNHEFECKNADYMRMKELLSMLESNYVRVILKHRAIAIFIQYLFKIL